ncbi:hypothetical protein [Streptomyces sp. NEAU-W12]|nr:hypothetical protein [Streptomyces sp. NEAU-W12]MCX2924748.1 hypothetical protein [Streptomyces sp. NEAU-W12]
MNHGWQGPVTEAKSARGSFGSEIVHRLEAGHTTVVADGASP